MNKLIRTGVLCACLTGLATQTDAGIRLGCQNAKPSGSTSKTDASPLLKKNEP